jgi:hypothetical protein
MSNPTNEPSCELTSKLTNQMDLDAELPSNFSSKRVKYSLSCKQDTELPREITDLTNAQTCGLCHDKKSEPESLAEQPIAATDSSQRGLCHGKKIRARIFSEAANCCNQQLPIQFASMPWCPWLALSKNYQFASKPWLALSKLLQFVSRPWFARSKLEFKQDVRAGCCIHQNTSAQKVQASPIFLPQTTIQFHHSS